MTPQAKGRAYEVVLRAQQAPTPEQTARELGECWHDVRGRKITNAALHRAVQQIAKASRRNRDHALAVVGDALMNTAERIAFTTLLRSCGDLSLVRFTDFTKFTGFFRSRAEARAQWEPHWAPLAVQTLTVSRDRLLCVKAFGAALEIVLDPKCAAALLPTWEALG